MNSLTHAAIEAKNIKKSFQEGSIQADILNGIDLSIQRGQQIALVGSSGSGKSTLLSILGALALPSSGELWIQGTRVSSLSDSERAKIRNSHLGFVYQFHHLLPEFTAVENVAMPLWLRKIPRRAAEQQAQVILEQVGLKHRYAHKPGELSGGERQRVAIARALVTKPACLLADEPTGNLDQKTAEQVYELMLQLNRELQTSILIATHDLKLAERMDVIIRIEDGKIQS